MKNILLINCSPVRNGATAEITKVVQESLAETGDIHSVCIDDYDFAFCKGCRSCHQTAKCVQQDEADKLVEEYMWADVIIAVAPSYWADIPGQFKAFIDRCTPLCNTHEPHATIGTGKVGYSIALRTGPSMRECERIMESIEHFHGHLEIASKGRLGLCSVEYKADVASRKVEIEKFCEQIKGDIR